MAFVTPSASRLRRACAASRGTRSIEITRAASRARIAA
jgi:hypothetical protein